MMKRSLSVFTGILICFLFVSDRAYSQTQPDVPFSGYMLMLGENTRVFAEPKGDEQGIVYENAFVKVLDEKDGYLKIQVDGYVAGLGSISLKDYHMSKPFDILDRPDGNRICSFSKNVDVKVIDSKNSCAAIRYSGWIRKPVPGMDDEEKEPYANIKDKASSTTDPWLPRHPSMR
jgi:hypothetical protein